MAQSWSDSRTTLRFLRWLVILLIRLFYSNAVSKSFLGLLPPRRGGAKYLLLDKEGLLPVAAHLDSEWR
jgi:hypothetical protein